MITDARPITIVPATHLISAKSLNWATREDETATRPLPRLIPKMSYCADFLRLVL